MVSDNSINCEALCFKRRWQICVMRVSCFGVEKVQSTANWRRSYIRKGCLLDVKIFWIYDCFSTTFSSWDIRRICRVLLVGPKVLSVESPDLVLPLVGIYSRSPPAQGSRGPGWNIDRTIYRSYVLNCQHFNTTLWHPKLPVAISIPANSVLDLLKASAMDLASIPRHSNQAWVGPSPLRSFDNMAHHSGPGASDRNTWGNLGKSLMP